MSAPTLLGKPLGSWWRVANQFVRYAVLGGCGALADLLIFALLTHLTGTPAVTANAVSVLFGIGTSFLLNSRWTFDHRSGWRRRLSKFLAVGFAGLLASSFMIWVFVYVLHGPPVLAKVLTLPPVALGQFIANRWWTFAAPRP